MRWRGRFAALALAGILAAGSTACREDRPADADRVFVAALIPHHHLGMELIADATTRSADVRLRELAFTLSTYHQSELARLVDWSGSWSVAAASTFPGALPLADVARLGELDGLDHDTWWLHLMIEHHLGALRVADAELAGGRVSAARAMAATLRTVQAEQIAAMRRLTAELCVEAPSAPGCADR